MFAGQLHPKLDAAWQNSEPGSVLESELSSGIPLNKAVLSLSMRCGVLQQPRLNRIEIRSRHQGLTGM